ncbi:hypothetical protein COEX109129_42550 [Corallococcus exiguus]
MQGTPLLSAAASQSSMTVRVGTISAKMSRASKRAALTAAVIRARISWWPSTTKPQRASFLASVPWT